MHSSNVSRRHFLAGALLAPLAAADADPLSTLRAAHPRLIALDSDIDRIRRLIQRNDDAARIYRQLVADARRIAAEPPVEYQLIGPRLLDKSRRALSRIYTLSLLHRLDGKREYAARALHELHAVCEFPNWNPSHFLDTAEMSHAAGIGYDWLHSTLTPSERGWIRRALVDKGIEPGLAVYRRGDWWTRSEFNWNQVCNGGLTAGALAIADEEPERAREVVTSAVKSLPVAMRSYAPDGGWAEGPGYWAYATRYTVYMLAALESALGADFGLSKAQGFDLAGRFRIYFSGPTGLAFNYADGSARVAPASEMFWLARRFANPVYAWQQRELLHAGRGDALDLVWFQEHSMSPGEANWALVDTFDGVNAGFLRSAWDSTDAVFAAIKGGDNKANHGHLDLGSFVLDAGGVRWATDLGADDYNLPQFFGKLRWTYYRNRTESHNTVLIDGENQNLSGRATLTQGRDYVEANLVDAYPDRLREWSRRMTLNNGAVTIRDRIRAKRPVEALWGMVTEAEVELDARKAELRKSGRRLRCEIVSPANAVFDTVSTRPPAPQNQNPGTRKLVVRLPEPLTEAEISVAMTLA